jgi:chromosome segregation ATPase
MNSSKASASNEGPLIKRILGICLIVFSALGLVISLSGLLAVFVVSRGAAQSAHDALMPTLDALETTSQSLNVVHSALGEAQDALSTMETVTEGTDDSLQNTEALIGSLSDALTGDLRRVILNSQRALTASQEGAAVIEEMLYGLNVISGLTGVAYRPEMSLTESFALISESLDTVPETLGEVDENLTAIEENLGAVQTGVADLTDTLDESEEILVAAQTSVEDYNNLVQELYLSISGLQQNLPNWIRLATYALYFLLAWLAISQIGLLWQGWEMFSYSPAQVEQRLDELEGSVAQLLQGAEK